MIVALRTLIWGARSDPPEIQVRAHSLSTCLAGCYRLALKEQHWSEVLQPRPTGQDRDFSVRLRSWECLGLVRGNSLEALVSRPRGL